MSESKMKKNHPVATKPIVTRTKSKTPGVQAVPVLTWEIAAAATKTRQQASRLAWAAQAAFSNKNPMAKVTPAAKVLGWPTTISTCRVFQIIPLWRVHAVWAVRTPSKRRRRRRLLASKSR